MSHRGGTRKGAGRPPGSGKFGEPTKAVRIPTSQVESVLKAIQHPGFRLPLYGCCVAAGFPTPAEGDIEEYLDLNEFLIKRPSATFFVRASGMSMIGAGIYHNDILIVDKSIEPTSGKIVIAAVNGELTVKRLLKEKGRLFLIAENEIYPPIEVSKEEELHIWGVVTNVIHPV